MQKKRPFMSKFKISLLFIVCFIFNNILSQNFLLASGNNISIKKNIFINIRVYHGIKTGDKKKVNVTSSFFLRPIFVSNMIPEIKINEEEKELKHIFNLKKIRLITKTQWSWDYLSKDIKREVIVIDGFYFNIKLSYMNINNKFNIDVLDGKSLKSLLKSNIILPSKKSIVIGFEDSQKSSYFLSIQRTEDKSIENSYHFPPKQIPQIEKYVPPVYPSVALKAKVQGKVYLSVKLKKSGKIERVKIIWGHPFLNKAAIESLKNYIFKPLNNVDSEGGVSFVYVIDFQLDDPLFKQKKNYTKSISKEQVATIPSIWPVKGYLTSTFGPKINPITKKKEFHKGIDITSHLRAEVKSTADGFILEVGSTKTDGNYIIIDHKNGYKTYYGRLDKYKYEKGEKIKRGQIIGYLGNTGQSTGPHLHYEILLNDKAINPLEIIFN